MSRCVSYRYELAHYDNASLSLSPPTYPPTLDQYRLTGAVSVPGSYGTQVVSGSGSVQLYAIPVGATVLMLPDPGNTTPIALIQSSVQLTSGGTPQNLYWPAYPAQPVTLPGALVQGLLSVAPVTPPSFSVNGASFLTTLVWWM